MAESSAETGVPNLNLTAEEKRVYGHLFRQADTESVGVVTGEIAVKFFEKTRLDSRVLGEIWQIADKENRGFLTPAGFGVVLRLIGHAQAGREPTPELALQQGPLPRFDGIAPTPPPPPPAAALPAQATGGRIAIPPLTPEKVAQYAALFERQPLQAGNMLPGDQAKSIFEKSGLPNEILGRIWMLADTEHRGALVQTEFVIAMHLLTSMKRGDLRALPTILPAPLYEAATRRGPIGGVIPRQQSPVAAIPPVPAVPRQLTGQASLTQMRTGSPLTRPPLAAQTTGDWLVTPADKARFDQLYEELDKTKKGFITGEEAVPFFSQSALPEDVLAQIWDLADFRSEGRLTRDEFAVAMYLIRQQRSKRDGAVALPATLPANLIPPSLRSQARPPTATSAFEPPPRPQPPQPKPSALDDLFGLDDPQPAAPAQVPFSTGGTGGIADPFATGMSPPAPSSPVRPSPVTSGFKPFVPSSSFGMGLTAQGTGGSTGSAPGLNRAALQPVEADLLGDTDPEISKSLTSETTELANLSNQVGSLTKQTQDVQAQRAKAQNDLNQATQQKKNFEQRLTQLRAMYEKEAQDVRSLETQLAASRKETQKLTSEMAMIDASHQDLQNQHRTVSAALQADQQENAGLKERIRVVNAEIAQLKPQIEKLKSEARQLKGLVAINKKQLATNEGERDKLKAEVEDLTKSNEELTRQVSSTSSPVLDRVASPALSTGSVNNPFFRRTGSTDMAATFPSPPPMRGFNDRTFDDVFGPSSQAGTPPPPAAAALFKPQNTGTSTGSVGSFATPGSTSPTVSRQATLAAEPPAPPEPRQISSSFLPFGDANEPLSLSRQVSPPLSRVSQAEGSQDSTATSGSQPIEAVPTGQSITSGSGSEAVKAPAAASPSEVRPPTSNGAQVTFGGPLTDEVKGPAASASDPFSVVDQAKAKEDFESAFASFKSSQASKTPSASSVDTSKAFNTFNSEFPPISELERDDESDSESGGFDDDFAPASPAKVAEKKAESRPVSPIVAKPAPEPASATGLGSPAAPDHTSNEKPVSPPPSSHGNINKMSGSSVDDIFGSVDGPAPSVTAAPPAAQQPAPAPTTATAPKGAFDDLDDDFEGLEDAKEGSADDDFGHISRDDFNPVFDSSPPPSQAKSESNATNFGVESSFDFGSLSGASVASGSTNVAGGPPGSSSGAKAATADSHDWDAIFAGLDETPTQSSPPIGSGTGDAKESSGAAAASRPSQVGRALAEDGAHDDPILKNLTSMGYSRKDALQALEKYDYNLERAANHLASQS